MGKEGVDFYTIEKKSSSSQKKEEDGIVKNRKSYTILEQTDLEYTVAAAKNAAR